MQVQQDMYFDELTYHIFVKKKIDDSEDEDDEDDLDYDNEYILYHEYRDDPHNNYFEIAKEKGYHLIMKMKMN